MLIIFSNTLFCQVRKPIKRNMIKSMRNFNQVKSAIMKADRYESMSDFGRAYNLYRNLIMTNYTDKGVLNGFVRNAVKVKKIKVCEIKLKELIAKDEDNDKTIEIMLKSFLGQLFFMTGREMQGNEIIKIINAFK